MLEIYGEVRTVLEAPRVPAKIEFSHPPDAQECFLIFDTEGERRCYRLPYDMARDLRQFLKQCTGSMEHLMEDKRAR